MNKGNERATNAMYIDMAKAVLEDMLKARAIPYDST